MVKQTEQNSTIMLRVGFKCKLHEQNIGSLNLCNIRCVVHANMSSSYTHNRLESRGRGCHQAFPGVTAGFGEL